MLKETGKTNEYTDVEQIIKQAIQNACPEKTLTSYSISGGCANLNIKIRFKDSNDPFCCACIRDKLR